MTRPPAAAELLGQFDKPAALASLTRAERWPFAGLQVKLAEINALALDGGLIIDTDFEVGFVRGNRWRNVVVRGCTFECDEVELFDAERVRFDGCTFEGVRIVGGKLRDVTFANCTLQDVILEGTVLDAVRIEGGTLEAVRLTKVQTSKIQLQDVGVRMFAGFEAFIEDLVVRGGTVDQARIGGGEWHNVDLAGVTLSGVEATQSALSEIRAKGGSVLNCSQSEGTLDGLSLESPERVLGFTLSAVTVSRIALAAIASGSALTIVRSVLEGLSIRDSQLIGTEIRESRVDAPVQLERVVVDGLDFRSSEVDQFAMRGGRVEGSVQLEGANIRRWTLDDTSLGDDLAITGKAKSMVESDPRLIARG